ncbi:hypothetical protein ACOMHN_008597 [Nucella lapillus]
MALSPLSWKRVVPWVNRSEFVQTYLDLYSQKPERQRRAVETISLWKCRVTHKLSVAIESSAALTRAYLLYQSAQDAGELRHKDFELSSIMTLAMIRFVNHVTEKGQNKAFAQPVHKLAQELGIPEWIVRLRHDGSHGSLPCLDVLTRGVQWALSYLQEVFWSQQVKEADEDTYPDARKRKKSSRSLYKTEEIQGLLLNYQKASYKSQQEGPDSEPGREEGRALKRIEHILNSQQRNMLLQCLVEPGHLQPTEQQLQVYHVDIDETLRADLPKVPGVVIKIWKAVLRLVQGRQLTGLLLQHMVTRVVGGEGDPASLHRLAMAAWLRLILLHHTSNFSTTSEERESQPSLYSGAVDFSKDLLLATCVQTPSILTSSLLRLVDTDSISEDAYRELKELDQAYRGGATASADRDHTDGDAKSREDAESPRKRAVLDPDGKRMSADAAMADGKNIWKLCTDPVDWEWMALGLLPGQDQAAESAAEGGGGGGGEHRGHGYYSSTDDDDDGRTSDEDEPDTTMTTTTTTTTTDHPAPDHREKSVEKPVKEEVIEDMYIH